MGMYNEVFSTCPVCGGRGYMQIHQIVLGFGGFYIDDTDSLADQLDEDQLQELHRCVMEGMFVCEGGDCHHHFNPLRSDTALRRNLARQLFRKG